MAIFLSKYLAFFALKCEFQAFSVNLGREDFERYFGNVLKGLQDYCFAGIFMLKIKNQQQRTQKLRSKFNSLRFQYF